MKNLCKEFCKKLWKQDNAWNIGRLVDNSLIPATQCIILKIVGFQVASSCNGMLLKLGYLWLTGNYIFHSLLISTVQSHPHVLILRNEAGRKMHLPRKWRQWRGVPITLSNGKEHQGGNKSSSTFIDMIAYPPPLI